MFAFLLCMNQASKHCIGEFKDLILYKIEGRTRKVDAKATVNQCLENRKIDGNGDEGGKLRGTEITIISGSGTFSFICFWARKL